MKKLLVTGILPVILGGFASALPPEVSPYSSPVDATNAIRNTQHRNATGKYTHRQAVDPKSWRPLNDRQSPDRGGRS